MPNPSIPPYKPPQELQEILKQQAAQRKRTAQLPKRNWIQRNPRLFQITFITTSLLVLFSRPLYDAFIEESFPALEDSIKFKKRE
ncbi:uncharacterized protein LOC119605092 [Lucilia sericata]|uniref:uncharacterized protein LOC119605092 n=1 Tax=Lucilia sericata TaxID=13632 RepID=UPI0018A86838|nr:uncharacterized protein LOC119605092 [Lucilia sericata]XP_037813964.1 uncharacterized protein LOC119605092 [Lucilia sericata]